MATKSVEKKNKGGKPALDPGKWLENDSLIRIQGWARDGLTNDQIAENMGIGLTTFYKWKNEYTEFANALKETKEICDRCVENALYQKALQGDTTAMIFWLKNRKQFSWRDKQEVEANVKGDYNIEIEIK